MKFPIVITFSLLLFSLASCQRPKKEEFVEDSGPAPASSPQKPSSPTDGVILNNKPHSPDDMEPADSNVPEEEKSKDPNANQEEPKTGSAFDFLNEQLDQEEDLSKTKQALDSPEAKELINKYGENLTIFAPNDQAFAQEKEPDDEEAKANFLRNHVVVGQRVPVYPPPPSNSGSPNKPTKSSGSPQVLRANIVVSGGPLVHVIDRLNSRPFDSATLCDLQPAMAAMMALLSSAQMRSALNQRSTFFCPSNEVISSLGNPDPEVVKRFIADHLVPGTSNGCSTGRPYLNGNGRPMSCFEGRTSIVLNGRIMPKRKVPTVAGMVFIIPSLAVDDAEYLPQLLNSGKPIRVTIQLEPSDAKATSGAVSLGLPPPQSIRLRPLRQPQLPQLPPSLDSNDVIPPSARDALKPLLQSLRDSLPKPSTTASPNEEANAPETPAPEDETPEGQPPPPPPKAPKPKKPKQKPPPPAEDEPETPAPPEETPEEQPEDQPPPPPPSAKPKKPKQKPTTASPDKPESPAQEKTPEEQPQEDTSTEEPPPPSADEPTPEEQPQPETPKPKKPKQKPTPAPEEDTESPPPSEDKPSEEPPKEEDPTEEPEQADQPSPSSPPPKAKKPKQKKPTTPAPEEPESPTEKPPQEDTPTEPPPPTEEDEQQPPPPPSPKTPKQKPTPAPEEDTENSPLPVDKPSEEPPKDEENQTEPPSPEEPVPEDQPSPEEDKPKPKKPKQKPTPAPEEPESPPEETPAPPEETPEEQPEEQPPPPPPKAPKPKKPKQKPQKKPKQPSPPPPAEDEPESPPEEGDQPPPPPPKSAKPKKPKQKPATPAPEEPETPPEETPEDQPDEQPPPPPKQAKKPAKKPKQKPTPAPEESESPPEETPEEQPEEQPPPPPPKAPKPKKPKQKPQQKPKQPPPPSPPAEDEPESPSAEDEEQQVPPPSSPDQSCSSPPCDQPKSPPSSDQFCPNPPCDQQPKSPSPPDQSCPNPPCDQQQPQPQPPQQQPESEPEPEQIEQKPESDNEPYLPAFEPSQQVSLPRKPSRDQLRSALQQSAKAMNCGRFLDWLLNSGVLDELMKRFKGGNCTVFLPVDSASSKLPFNMLQSMNSNPQKQRQLMKLHTVPSPFNQIYPSSPQRAPKSQPPPPVPSFSQQPLRFDRSLLRSPSTGQYVPLVSGCPMLDSHQVGPMRLVSLGSVLFPPQPDLYSVLKRSPNLKLCREIVDQSGLAKEMQASPSGLPGRSHTMFMPSDQALAKRYSQRQLSSLVRDPGACRDFVNRHLIKDRSVYSNSIPISPEQELDPSFRGRSCQLNSAAEDPLRIKRTSQSFYVNRAHVGYSDISCNNGVAHIMNDMF